MLADFAKHEQLAIEVSTDNKESQEKLKSVNKIIFYMVLPTLWDSLYISIVV